PRKTSGLNATPATASTAKAPPAITSARPSSQEPPGAQREAPPRHRFLVCCCIQRHRPVRHLRRTQSGRPYRYPYLEAVMNPDITWEEYVRARRAEGFKVTGRWINGAPVLVRLH